jgi:16S rRNA (cytosine1407-C5)-methyltransferase
LTTLPPALAERLEALLGGEYGEYLRAVESPPRPCIRVNTLKGDADSIAEGLRERGVALEPVPWCSTGYWVDGDLGKSVEHFQGLFYMQDAASLLPPEALAPTGEGVVLDAAAAPGGKTTHLAALMENRGALVANEVDAHRTRVLRFNLNRMGVANAAVSTLDMSRAPDTGPIFDGVLLDAPCSCEGRIGEDAESLAQWRPARVQRCSRLQARLIDSCYSLLAPGGVLVYSTCTMAPEENEGVVNGLLRKYGDAEVEAVEAAGRHVCGVTEWNGEKYDDGVSRCIRLYPHHHATQGFFIARIRRCR